MKSYNHLFEIATSDDVIMSSLLDASERKKERFEVKRILDNIPKYTKLIKKWLTDGDYKVLPTKAVEINDGYILKKRIIILPRNFIELWKQHIVVTTLKPIFMKGMYDFSCGSIPDRGPHHGKRHIEKFIKNNPKEIKYVLKLDIHHFFASVDTDILKAKFKKVIHDERMLNFIYYILNSNTAILDGNEVKEGLPIGYYTSTWFANWLLQPLDHYIKEELKVLCYVRYMDDIVIFGKNKKELHKKLESIREFLSNLNLDIKGNYQIFRFDYIDRNGNRRGRFIDFMGFKFYRDKTTIRGSIFIRAIRKARRIKQKEKISWYDASQILSYLGWFRHTNTYGAFKKYIVPNVNIKQCKKLISNHSKKAKE